MNERWEHRSLRVEQEIKDMQMLTDEEQINKRADAEAKDRNIPLPEQPQFIPFDPWYQEPVRIARLLRWLILMKEPPADIADFIEHAESWQEQYSEMCVWDQANLG